MSMTVKTAIQGVTDLELLLAALKEMDLPVTLSAGKNDTVRGRKVLARVRVAGRTLGIARNGVNRSLELVGDQDWGIMKDKAFTDRIRQQYGVAAVKRKVETLQYQIASIDTEVDGSIRIVARSWG